MAQPSTAGRSAPGSASPTPATPPAPDRATARDRFRAYFRIHAELARLADADLARLGLTREGISDIALRRAYG